MLQKAGVESDEAMKCAELAAALSKDIASSGDAALSDPTTLLRAPVSGRWFHAVVLL